MTLKPHEFQARGRRNPKTGAVTVEYLAGAAVSAEQKAFLQSQLTERRRTILNLFNEELPLEPSFIEELEQRDYDLASLRFRVALFSPENKFPRYLRTPVQRPGVMHARWARLPYDSTPDLVCSWHRPCSKRDSNMFHGFFSQPVYGPDEQRGTSLRYDRDLMSEMKRVGFDIRTLKFEVRHSLPLHPDDVA